MKRVPKIGFTKMLDKPNQEYYDGDDRYKFDSYCYKMFSHRGTQEINIWLKILNIPKFANLSLIYIYIFFFKKKLIINKNSLYPFRYLYESYELFLHKNNESIFVKICNKKKLLKN